MSNNATMATGGSMADGGSPSIGTRFTSGTLGPLKPADIRSVARGYDGEYFVTVADDASPPRPNDPDDDYHFRLYRGSPGALKEVPLTQRPSVLRDGGSTTLETKDGTVW